MCLSMITIECKLDDNKALGFVFVFCFLRPFRMVSRGETRRASASCTILSKSTAEKDRSGSVSVVQKEESLAMVKSLRFDPTHF
jgi:hypothetical protein